jgi:tRNA uridine 5-carboxymethylaminomethyl modification enzyme
MAGINAALKVHGKPAFVLERDQAYVGILIDDLVTKGTNEPYRMFTSRAEFRLHLRIDNADQRLTPLGRQIGLVSETAFNRYQAKQERLERLMSHLNQVRVQVEAGKISAAQALKRPEIKIEAFLDSVPGELREQISWEESKAVETSIKYEGYLKQQTQEIEKMRKAESRGIPLDFEYHAIPGLSREMIEKLSRVRPTTIGLASRIPGVTPAALSILHIQLEMTSNRAQTA